MFKVFLLFILFFNMTFAQFSSTISPIKSTIKHKMIQGHSYKRGCPVGLKNLRYIELIHKDFNDRDKKGVLIVHHSVTKDIVNIFRELYAIKYPIKKMRLVSNYKAKDWVSIEADNTSAFNCRSVGGTHRWSRHSFGKAIDINPIENPYISRSGYISHKASLKYKKRAKKKHKAMILQNDKITKIFKKYGWQWGGNFKGEKDYQHFFKK